MGEKPLDGYVARLRAHNQAAGCHGHIEIARVEAGNAMRAKFVLKEQLNQMFSDCPSEEIDGFLHTQFAP
jgi:hypothetical protein